MPRSRPFSPSLALILLLAAGAPSLRAGEPAPPAPAARPIAPLAWLVGGVWTADCAKLGGGMKAIETRYRWSDNDAFIRFTTHFVSEKGTLKNYDGSFFSVPGQTDLQVWYMDHGGAITQGAVTVDGNTTRIAFRATDFEGKLADMRADVVRASDDLYTWTLREKNGDAWKDLLSLEYRRVAGS